MYMATESSHRVIMGKNVVSTLAPSFLIGSSSYLQVTKNDARISFLLHILRMNGQNLTKFCIHIIIDKIYVGIVKHHILANLQQSYDP